MKKLFAILLAVAVICALSVTAFAATSPQEFTTIDGTTSKIDDITVQGKYVTGDVNHNYKVVISWGNMQFNYTAAEKTWDVEELDWTTEGTAQWSAATAESNKITVVNYSSEDVVAAFEFAGESGMTGSFGGDASNDQMTIGSAAENKQAVTKTATFMPTGTLADSVNDYTAIGTITVTLSK